MEFLPISVCSVVYKIVSKVIVNRLKPIMDQIISKFQSAFFPGYLLMIDNTLIAFETCHYISALYGQKKRCIGY